MGYLPPTPLDGGFYHWHGNRFDGVETLWKNVTSSAFQLFVMFTSNCSAKWTNSLNLHIFRITLNESFFIVVSNHFSLSFEIGFMNFAKYSLSFLTVTRLLLLVQSKELFLVVKLVLMGYCFFFASCIYRYLVSYG